MELPSPDLTPEQIATANQALRQRNAAQIDHAFTCHPPQADQSERYRLRGEFKLLALLVNALCPPSRETALALTNLEQANFWATAAIARNE
ncbi:MAG: hypothetical protein K2Y37_14725 [Pirellulales bacterium]|nr:hypothetical protein [Pirellulales bacterium]